MNLNEIDFFPCFWYGAFFQTIFIKIRQYIINKNSPASKIGSFSFPLLYTNSFLLRISYLCRYNRYFSTYGSSIVYIIALFDIITE